MQINTSTDYAIRLILYLASESKTVSSSKLAAAIGVSPRYLLQISAKLRDAGFIEVTYGGNGGFSLLQPATKITLYDIIIVMEGSIVNKSFPEGKAMQEEFKFLNAAYKYVSTVLIDILKSITIESLLSQSIKEWYLAPYLNK
jgi:Rrf2 family protein